MAVDDRWYLSKHGPRGQRLRSQRYGRGKRWRVRYKDASGEPRERLFDRKADADAWDAQVRTGVVRISEVDRGEGKITFREYAIRWLEAREFSWEIETRRRIPGNLTHHLYPEFGDRPIRAITLTDVLGWISRRLAAGTPKSSMKLYYELFNTIMKNAVLDRAVTTNPCEGIKLAAVFRGLSTVPRWVPTEAQVIDLFAAVPERYHAALWLGAGQACRIGEALAIEDSARCFDFDARELHVVQQLQFDNPIHGGFYLKEPKGGSAGTVELDEFVGQVLADHLHRYPATEVELVDAINGKPVRRTAALLFTDQSGRPFHDRRWSEHWTPWRKAAGWPEDGGTFHALRHFCATTMLTNHVDPQHVQKMLRHASLQVTLTTYVHWLPRAERPKNIVSTVLRAVART